MQPQGDEEIIIKADKKMIVNSEMWRDSSHAKVAESPDGQSYGIMPLDGKQCRV